MKKLFALAAIALGTFFAQATQAQTYTYTFTPQYTLPCTGANQAPLDPTKWYSVGVDGPGQLPMYDELEVASAVCTTSIQVTHDGQGSLLAAAGVSKTSQYLGFTVAKVFVANESAAFIYLKSGEPWLAPSLNVSISGSTGVPNGMQIDVVTFDANSNITHDWGIRNVTIALRDTVVFAFSDQPTSPVSPGEWYLFVNNVMVENGLCGATGAGNQWCPSMTNGTVGLQLDSIGSGQDFIGVTHITAGNFSTTHP